MDFSDLFSLQTEGPDLTPEQRIKFAALGCIEELGLEGTTVRAIAAKAELNPAAVNYYFRSKDRLVEEALRGAWSHVAEDVDRIASNLGDRAEIVDMTVRFLVEGASRYPNIIRAIIVEHPTLRLEVAAFFQALFRRLGTGDATEGDSSLGAALLISFCVFLGFAADAASLLAGLDLSSAAARAEIASGISRRLFPNMRHGDR